MANYEINTTTKSTTSSTTTTTTTTTTTANNNNNNNNNNNYNYYYYYYYYYYDVPSKVVGTATRYGLDGPGFEPRTDLEAHQSTCAMGTGVVYLRKSGWNVALTIHPHTVPTLKKE